MPIFSVITPAYNAAATIAHTIQSIQAQTIMDWEHIVVDDGSTDNTASIVKELTSQDPRLQLFSTRKKGVSAARNFAMKHATGEFLAFLDADDEAIPSRLEFQYRALARDPSLAAVGSSVELFGDMNKIITPSTDSLEIAIHMLFSCDFFLTSSTIRKNIQTHFKFWFNPEYEPCEDWEFFSRLIRTQRMMNLPEVLTRYRRSNTQITAELTDRVDDQAAHLRHNQLVWLGVPENEIDLEAHIAISPCYWPLKKNISPDAFEITRVTNWIKKLILINEKTNRYPSNNLRQILHTILEAYHVIH